MACLQRYFGAAAGKGRQSARTTLERLNLKDLTCRQAITEIAKMCALSLLSVLLLHGCRQSMRDCIVPDCCFICSCCIPTLYCCDRV